MKVAESHTSFKLNDQLEDDMDGGYTREVVQRILAAKDEELVSESLS